VTISRVCGAESRVAEQNEIIGGGFIMSSKSPMAIGRLFHSQGLQGAIDYYYVN